jgi:hypothetical protein
MELARSLPATGFLASPIFLRMSLLCSSENGQAGFFRWLGHERATGVRFAPCWAIPKTSAGASSFACCSMRLNGLGGKHRDGRQSVSVRFMVASVWGRIPEGVPADGLAEVEGTEVADGVRALLAPKFKSYCHPRQNRTSCGISLNQERRHDSLSLNEKAARFSSSGSPYHQVGATGFEPATFWSQTRRASQAAPRPACSLYYWFSGAMPRGLRDVTCFGSHLLGTEVPSPRQRLLLNSHLFSSSGP